MNVLVGGTPFALEDLPDALPWGIGAITGALLAVLSLVACLLLVRLALAKRTTISVITAVATQLVGYPSLWFGAPWATTALVSSLKVDDEFKVAYMCALFAVFFLPLIPIVIRLAVRVWGEV